MGFIKSIFGGSKDDHSSKKQNDNQTSAVLKIKQIERLTKDAVKIVFDVPESLKEKYAYIPGQYLDFIINIDGTEVHRSYSICSDISEPLAIGVKQIEGGYVSIYLNEKAKAGDEIEVSFPMGQFTIPKIEGEYFALAGGSGITPILSIAKLFNRTEEGKLNLFYGNRSDQSIMFEEEIKTLSEDKVSLTHIFSDQEKEGFLHGMLTEEMVTSIIKSNLDLLKSKGFYVCGPEQVILNTQNALKKFGVPDDKIYFELFTTPVAMESSTKAAVPSDFKGISKVTVILDDEEEKFDLASNGDTILEEAESYGLEPPYSCRGAICCTCKAKVLKGSAKMDKNFTLTDEEVAEGYILTCQSHPTSEELTVSYDE